MKMNRDTLFGLLLILGLLFSRVVISRQIVVEGPIIPSADLVYDKIRDSIVLIENENKSGTGFFIETNKVATSIHVVAHAGPIIVKSSDEEKNWTIEGVVAFDVENKFVILKVTGEGTPLPLGNSDTVQIGESISILDYPDRKYKVMDGSVKSIRKGNKWLRINTTTL